MRNGKKLADVLGVMLGGCSVGAWAWLLCGRGRFWRSGPVLAAAEEPPERRVTAIVPARNEEEHIEQSLRSLLDQRFPGELRVVLVDDRSSDRTAVLANGLAAEDARLNVVPGAPLTPGWTGKMWAVAQGLARPEALAADYILLTDADIVHGPGHVASLVAAAERDGLDLVSEMVRLRVHSLAERALMPAFVFFFQMLYPFAWVSDPQRTEAAAAGGTMLVTRAALERIGGIERIRGELIDDVALAREVKRGGHRIWLGHAREVVSLRRLPRFSDAWSMIARTAYVQLRHEPLLLAGSIAGLVLVYVVPVSLALFGQSSQRALGCIAWGMMAFALQPTLVRYRRSPLWGLALPAITVFYMGATVASALRFHAGRGGEWKGRTYAASSLA